MTLQRYCRRFTNSYRLKVESKKAVGKISVMKIPIPDYIKKIAPYVPGKPIEELEREYGVTDSVKLASNENPLGPSPKAMAGCGRGRGWRR